MSKQLHLSGKKRMETSKLLQHVAGVLNYLSSQELDHSEKIVTLESAAATVKSIQYQEIFKDRMEDQFDATKKKGK